MAKPFEMLGIGYESPNQQVQTRIKVRFANDTLIRFIYLAASRSSVHFRKVFASQYNPARKGQPIHAAANSFPN